MLTKITKKEFIELLKNNSSWFIQSALNQKTDRKTACENCFNQWDTEKIKSSNPCRTVEKATVSKVLFCDGSALDFNQSGVKTYYRFDTKNSSYLVQETVTFDEFDNENRYHYIIYLI